MHVHVKGEDGDAKVWLEPKIELAMQRNYLMSNELARNTYTGPILISTLHGT